MIYFLCVAMCFICGIERVRNALKYGYVATGETLMTMPVDALLFIVSILLSIGIFISACALLYDSKMAIINLSNTLLLPLIVGKTSNYDLISLYPDAKITAWSLCSLAQKIVVLAPGCFLILIGILVLMVAIFNALGFFCEEFGFGQLYRIWKYQRTSEKKV